jgi:hypothetical protein
MPLNDTFIKNSTKQAAARHGLRAYIFDQVIPGYGNAAFRFNVLLESVTHTI